ncbi:MAG: sarcosine oxidase subunit gamma, partial [Woeseiaceae bacterium]
AYGCAIPEPGSSNPSDDGELHLLGLQNDQIFALLQSATDQPATTVSDRLGNVSYCTDQSDSWAMLRLSGSDCRLALRRICMLDLDPDCFTVGAVARTTMEHLGVIVWHDTPDSFLLLSPRSSAHSFLHAVELSILNTVS